MKEDLKNKLKEICLIIFDVDGVLTDGRLYYGERGECIKVFNAKDGLGISHLMQNGYQGAIITRRQSSFVTRRAADLGIQHVYQGQLDKLPVFESLLQSLSLKAHQVAYMGDDCVDIPVLKRVGCAACPQDAMPCVREICSFISQFNGGCGAARELCDAIWEAQHLCDF